MRSAVTVQKNLVLQVAFICTRHDTLKKVTRTWRHDEEMNNEKMACLEAGPESRAEKLLLCIWRCLATDSLCMTRSGVCPRRRHLCHGCCHCKKLRKLVTVLEWFHALCSKSFYSESRAMGKIQHVELFRAGYTRIFWCSNWESSLDLFTWRPEDHAKERPNIKLYQHGPQRAKTHFCVIVTSEEAQGSVSGCFFWMPLLCRVHPAMAPRPLPQMSPSPSAIAHYNGTLQWLHVRSRHPPLTQP